MSSNTSPLPTVAIVTVVYNRREDVVSLLTQIAQLDFPRERIDVFLVDNASTDGVADFVRSNHPEVHLIENSHNAGVAAGFNLGMTFALAERESAKYIWLLDSDVGLEPQSLAPLVAAMECDESIGVAGSAVYDPKQRDRLVAAGFQITWDSRLTEYVIPDPDSSLELIDVDLIAACSLMVRSEPCRKLGLWDSKLRLYWGDTDWCARFKAAGYRVVCVPTSKAWHRDWTATHRGFFMPAYAHDHVRGALLFLVRHDPAHSLRSARRLILKFYLRAALEQLTMRLGFARAYEFAVTDFLAGSFESRDFESLTGTSLLPKVEDIVAELAHVVPKASCALIQGIDEPSRQAAVKAALEGRFANIQCSIEEPRPGGAAGWLAQLLPLVGGILAPWTRYDILVTDVARPRISNLSAARSTAIIDGKGQGIVYKNRVLPQLWRLATTLLRGLRTAWIDLPRAVNHSAVLKRAIADNEAALVIPPQLTLSPVAAARTS